MKKKALTGLAFTIFAFGLLLIPRERISDAVSESVIFCGRTVIPQLFLYLCISSIIWELGIIENIISAFPNYGPELSCFLMGILSGFPSGALISGKLYNNGMITKRRAEYLNTFSNNASVSFILGYVSKIIGIKGAFAVFICQIISSITFAIIGRAFLSPDDKRTSNTVIATNASASSVIKAVGESSVKMINICGYILFFSAFSMGILRDFPTVIRGLLEMTTGLSITSVLEFPTRLIYSALFIGFGGLCVNFQVNSVCDVSPWKYTISKCISGLIFPPLTFLIYNAF